LVNDENFFEEIGIISNCLRTCGVDPSKISDIFIYNIQTKQQRTLFKANQGFGIDDYVLSANKKYLAEFEKAINDDLNTPQALQILWKLVRDEKAEGKYQTIKKMDEVFGLDLLKKEKIKIPADVKKLLEEREKFRKEKNWKKADELRSKINKLGFIVNDKSEGYEVKKG